MTEFVRDKELITQTLLSLNPELGITLTQAKKLWWRNFRNEGGLALTYAGYEAFTLSEIAYWDFNLLAASSLPTKLLLDLDKKIPCPYYLSRIKSMQHRITVYDSRVAVLIGLHSSVLDYLKAIN